MTAFTLILFLLTIGISAYLGGIMVIRILNSVPGDAPKENVFNSPKAKLALSGALVFLLVAFVAIGKVKYGSSTDDKSEKEKQEASFSQSAFVLEIDQFDDREKAIDFIEGLRTKHPIFLFTDEESEDYSVALGPKFSTPEEVDYFRIRYKIPGRIKRILLQSRNDAPTNKRRKQSKEV